jgi:hypothetical protein
MASGYNATLTNRKPLEASFGQIEVSAGNAVMKSPVAGFIVGKRLEEGDLAYWNENENQFVVEPGPVTLSVGASSADIRLRESVVLPEI